MCQHASCDWTATVITLDLETGEEYAVCERHVPEGAPTFPMA